MSEKTVKECFEAQVDVLMAIMATSADPTNLRRLETDRDGVRTWLASLMNRQDGPTIAALMRIAFAPPEEIESLPESVRTAAHHYRRLQAKLRAEVLQEN